MESSIARKKKKDKRKKLFRNISILIIVTAIGFLTASSLLDGEIRVFGRTYSGLPVISFGNSGQNSQSITVGNFNLSDRESMMAMISSLGVDASQIGGMMSQFGDSIDLSQIEVLRTQSASSEENLSQIDAMRSMYGTDSGSSRGGRTGGAFQSGSGSGMTIPLTRSEINTTMLLSGAVFSGETANVYSNLSFPVQAVNARVGNEINAGDVLAEIDVTRLIFDVRQAENNYLNALQTAESDERTRLDNIQNAQNSLESARLAYNRQQIAYREAVTNLIEAQATHANPFDPHSHNQTITDAGITLERRNAELNRLLADVFDDTIHRNNIRDALTNLERRTTDYEKAVSDLEEAQENSLHTATQTNITEAAITLSRREDELRNALADLWIAENEFDDYTHQITINEAKITLERRITDFEDAEEALSDAMRRVAGAFDDYNHQNAISNAQRDLSRRRDDQRPLQEERDAANNAIRAATTEAERISAQTRLDTAERNLETARRATADAETVLERAQNDLQRALNDFRRNDREQRTAEVDAAQNRLNNASTAVDDARRAYERAITDLERAKESALQNANTRVDTARTAVDDAKRAYDRTFTDLERAVESTRTARDDAQNTYDRAVNDLERARRDAGRNTSTQIDSARNSAEDAQRTYDRAVADKIRAEERAIEDAERNLTTAEKRVIDELRALETAEHNLLSAQNALDQAITRTISTSNVENQRISLERLQMQLEEAYIIAPIDGVITESNIQVGANPTGILFVIEDNNNLYVTTRVREHSVGNISIGQRVYVMTDATGDEIFEGRVTYISPRAVSPAGSTSVEFEVRAAIHNPNPAIRIGMNAFIEIVTSSVDAFTVPITMIRSDRTGSYVFAYNEDGVPVAIPVTVGATTAIMAEISGENLHEGLRLIVNPDQALAEAASND